MKMKAAAWLQAGALALGLLAGPQAMAQAAHPADHWEFGVETGYLAKIRNNSLLEYRIVPVQAVWRSPALFDLWNGPDGARLTVRNRIALVGEAIVRGPESHYFAVAGAPTF
ncbi:MAG TPA: hypothetical protein VEB23_09195, partial [Ramlibacter sp.]|nr:hypothetical protein [Ramlibacter sp.]